MNNLSVVQASSCSCKTSNMLQVLAQYCNIAPCHTDAEAAVHIILKALNTVQARWNAGLSEDSGP
jgi:hypothetical protein